MSLISMTILQEKLGLFLTVLGEESLAEYASGLCNGFAFMNFRADVIGEDDKNVARMETLMIWSDESIKEYAQSYREYKAARQSLIEMKEHGTDFVVSIEMKEGAAMPLVSIDMREGLAELIAANVEVRAQETRLTMLRKGYQEKEAILLQEEIRALRQRRDGLVDNMLKKQFGEYRLKRIQEAKELYLYVHSILGGFDPRLPLELRVKQKPVQQHDYLEILQLLPPDAFLPLSGESSSILESKYAKEMKLPLEQVFAMPFVFTKEELLALLSNKLHPNTIRDNDYLQLGSTDHVMYLSKKNGIFRLYNPGPTDIKDEEDLVNQIEAAFFKNFDKDSTFMPINISIFEKTNTNKAKEERPDAVELVRTLLGNRPSKNVDAQGWDGATAAFLAAKYGNDKVLKELIQWGAKVDIPTTTGNEAVRIAVTRGFINVVEMLLAEGRVDLNSRNKNGDTLIGDAAFSGGVDMVNVLALHGASLDITDKKGRTAISLAALGGKADVIRVLAKHGADINKFDLDFWTPLRRAIVKREFEVIKVLLEHGAHLHIKGKDGKTAIYTANKEMRAFIIEQLMQKYDADFKKDIEWAALWGKESKQGFDENTRRLQETELHLHRVAEIKSVCELIGEPGFTEQFNKANEQAAVIRLSAFPRQAVFDWFAYRVRHIQYKYKLSPAEKVIFEKIGAPKTESEIFAALNQLENLFREKKESKQSVPSRLFKEKNFQGAVSALLDDFKKITIPYESLPNKKEKMSVRDEEKKVVLHALLSEIAVLKIRDELFQRVDNFSRLAQFGLCTYEQALSGAMTELKYFIIPNVAPEESRQKLREIVKKTDKQLTSVTSLIKKFSQS